MGNQWPVCLLNSYLMAANRTLYMVIFYRQFKQTLNTNSVYITILTNFLCIVRYIITYNTFTHLYARKKTVIINMAIH